MSECHLGGGLSMHGAGNTFLKYSILIGASAFSFACSSPTNFSSAHDLSSGASNSSSSTTTGSVVSPVCGGDNPCPPSATPAPTPQCGGDNPCLPPPTATPVPTPV